MITRLLVFFFFQAEDGIRDKLVTGVQTCALPIFPRRASGNVDGGPRDVSSAAGAARETGPRPDRRASARRHLGVPSAAFERPGGARVRRDSMSRRHSMSHQ